MPFPGIAVTSRQRSLSAPPLLLTRKLNTAMSSLLSLLFFKRNRPSYVTPLEVSLTDRGLVRAERWGAVCSPGLLLSLSLWSDECPGPSDSGYKGAKPRDRRDRSWPGPARPGRLTPLPRPSFEPTNQTPRRAPSVQSQGSPPAIPPRSGVDALRWLPAGAGRVTAPAPHRGE